MSCFSAPFFCWQTCFDGRSLCLNAAYKGTKRTQSESESARERRQNDRISRSFVSAGQANRRAVACWQLQQRRRRTRVVRPQHCGTKLRTDQQRLSVFDRVQEQLPPPSTGQRTKKHESTLHKHNIGHCPPVQMTLTLFASSSKRNLIQAHGLAISSKTCTGYAHRLLSARYCYFSVVNGQLIRSAVHCVSKLQ